MLRKISGLFFLIFLTSCSAFPYRIVRVSDAAEPVQVQPLIVSTCPDPCPSCPQPVCPQPVCPQPVCPTWPVGVPTQVDATEKPPILLTATRTPITPTSTWTFSPTVTPTMTRTATFTATTTFTNTPTQTTTPTQTPLPTLTRTPTLVILPYSIQPSTPAYLQNFSHPEAGCNWMGVAGQVFNRAGGPILNMVVVVEGIINNAPVEGIGLTGLNNAYGPGGYEIQLGSGVAGSLNSVSITLYDLAGVPMTNPFSFSTFADCSRNLIVINFNQQ
ncbi:MAG: hypothetical protein IT308_10860 [Anaerolineaceae bacterium]|nr:hypothetical protein [Anaerolineaceae bacterium]